MFRLRMVGKIVRQAGLGHITAVFFAIFLVCSLVIWLGCPQIATFGDALWLCFESVTTIGYGDLPTSGIVCRVAIVLLSVTSIFYLAVITGVVVAYCNELIQSQSKQTVAKMAHDLEHLDELTPEELRELSVKARELK